MDRKKNLVQPGASEPRLAAPHVSSTRRDARPKKDSSLVNPGDLVVGRSALQREENHRREKENIGELVEAEHARVIELEGIVSGLQQANDKLAADVAHLDSIIKGHQSTIGTLEEQLRTVKQQLDAANARVTALTSELSAATELLEAKAQAVHGEAEQTERAAGDHHKKQSKKSE